MLGLEERTNDIEVANHLARDLGVKVRFVVARIEDFAGLGRKGFDVVMESAVLPVACRRDIPRKSLLKQLREGRSFLRAARKIAGSSGALFLRRGWPPTGVAKGISSYSREPASSSERSMDRTGSDVEIADLRFGS